MSVITAAVLCENVMHERFEKERPGEELDGRELLIRHQDGDSAAFSALIDLYRAPVCTYLCRCGITNLERDDLFQEVFIKVHLNAGRYDRAMPLKPWLFTIMANTVRSHFRKEKTKLECLSGS